MDFNKVDDTGNSLDELVTDIKLKNTPFKSVFSDPSKFIKNRSDNKSIEIKDLDDLYLKGKEDSKGLLDEHPFMRNLDCKSRTEYCFTNKDISKKCFDKSDTLYKTYILPCKMRTELKKIINFINNQDIEKYKDSIGFRSQYLSKGVYIHFNRVLPLFNFNENEVISLLESGRDYDDKKNIFSNSIESEGGRGMYFEYLLKSFNKDNKLLHDIIDKYIDILIINFKYNEVKAIDSAFKFLNTLVVGSESFNSIEKYYLEQFRKFKEEQRKLLYSSESE
tara:strand:+ start:567 stop:1400 length:834 start_codon:yes stop_codon:yes gene_type:complete